jgi:hypothetical protein
MGMHETTIGFRTLQTRLECELPAELVRKKDLHCGDLVLVRTKNSLYSIYVLENEQYLVSGGWFDRRGVSPRTVEINGCTWGGTAIKQDIVAGRGLFLEFGNQVVTTRIEDFRIIRAESVSKTPN